MSQASEGTDEEIAAAVQGGNSQSFGMLVERYEEKLMRYARRFLLAGDDAKDLVQEAFIKAYMNIRGFDSRRRFSPWIYRIAHNEFVNAIRKRRGRENFSLFDFDVLFPHPAAKESADEEANRQELKDALNKCLQKLGAKYREPLILHYFEEMSYGEIAEIMQIPVSTVGVRLKRGREMLKKMMAEINQHGHGKK